MNKRQKRAFYDRIEGSYLSVTQKEFVYGALKEALNLPAEKRIKRVRTQTTLMTLLAWEQLRGNPLAYTDLSPWAQRKKLCLYTVKDLVEEFRSEMISKGKEYADFVATFQTYLNKGYLSKKFPQVLWVNSPYNRQDGVTTMQAGASI